MPKKSAHSKPHPGYAPRRVATRDVLSRILIVCEGEKTEPNYFRGFRVQPPPRGFGLAPLDLVKKAAELSSDGDYDQAWCVFDRDDVSADEFNAAIAMAAANGIRVAYSNQAFELWYLLHFNYHDTAMARRDYIEKLGELLGHSYAKKSETMYRELEGRQADAIRNASRLLAEYEHPNPVSDDPSTTVHLLVEELRRHLR